MRTSWMKCTILRQIARHRRELDSSAWQCHIVDARTQTAIPQIRQWCKEQCFRLSSLAVLKLSKRTVRVPGVPGLAVLAFWFATMRHFLSTVRDDDKIPTTTCGRYFRGGVLPIKTTAISLAHMRHYRLFYRFNELDPVCPLRFFDFAGFGHVSSLSKPTGGTFLAGR